MRRFTAFWLAVGFGLLAFPGFAGEKTEVSLLLSSLAVKPGGTLMVGVRLDMKTKYHSYWRNPGESGSSTKIAWSLPAGITAGEIQWPAPEKEMLSALTTFGYEGEVVLLVPLKVGAEVKPGMYDLRAKVSWLECFELCVPGSAEVSNVVEVSDAFKVSPDAAKLVSWKAKIPVADPEVKVTADWVTGTNDTRKVFIYVRLPQGGTEPEFYPYGGETFDFLPAAKVSTNGAGGFTIEKTIQKLEGAWPPAYDGIIVYHDAKAARKAAEVQVILAMAETKTASDPVTNQGGPGRTAGSTSTGLLGMLGLAFLGGLILNIMPCVLPVIALKILGFVQQGKQSPREVRKLGLIYALGVIASFVVLALFVISVQRGGGAASWGMQMQNPYFRMALLVVVVLVALNLFGLFEVTLGGGAMGGAVNLASKDGAAGAFFNGVLATALATPCTAPFLTVALGFAFTQPPAIILLMFVVTALGLAAPYVLLSWQPQWLKFLPKPGVWMERFKVGMGFPMLATAFWLFDLTAPSFGEGGALWIGLFLVSLALAAWIWGTFVQRGTKRPALSMGMAIVVLGAGYALTLEGELNWRHPAKPAAAGVVRDAGDEGIEWQPWSAMAVEKARSEGRPVMVDFTAKWCLTCKANKKTSIEIASVRAKLKEINAVTFRADNTDPSPVIAEELKKFGRAGVPLVLLFPKDTSKPPIELPAILTPGIVLEALDKLK